MSAIVQYVDEGVSRRFNEALEAFSAEQRPILIEAAGKAVRLHALQAPRPSGERYANHVVRVASRIVNEFGIVDAELFIAGLYHDTIEDQLDLLCGVKGASRQQGYDTIRDLYSPRVSRLVKGMTNPLEYEEAPDRLAKIDVYMRHVQHVCDTDDEVFVVKLSDLFDNAMQLQQVPDEARRLKGARKYHGALEYFYKALRSDRSLALSNDIRVSLAERIAQQLTYIDGLIDASVKELK